MISPNFCSVIINSEQINKYPIYQRTLKFKIGFVPQNGGFFHDLTVYQNLKAIAEIIPGTKAGNIISPNTGDHPQNFLPSNNTAIQVPIITEIKVEKIAIRIE